jgi:hypothetical protein
MDTNTAGRERPGLWNRWPATTLSIFTGLTGLAVLLATGAPADSVEEADEPGRRVLLALAADIRADAAAEAAAADMEDSDEEAGGTGTRHKGEEGKMGKPTSSAKSGLYAMKGPRDPILPTGGGHFLASPYGGAFAVGSDDADVWGGLTGTEIGEAYGVGGLGLVGTGRGGGGTGEGTIGLGTGGKAGHGSGRAAERGSGSFDGKIQSRVLTVGTLDDNADPHGYKDALKKMRDEISTLGINDAMWQLSGPKVRHDANPRNLDVALVIDTTGSMGDELEYLKVELRDIAREVAVEFPDVAQRWGMVVYRDNGDEYVTRDADFQGIEKFIAALGRQEANGGGDLPEAMDVALRTSERLSWRTGDDTARVVFLVADAPTHPGVDARRFANSVMAHRAAKTAIYPVASSGAATEAEAEMRLAARVTGGQYIFLTDHSGVGGGHAAPHADQYKVESLHAAMTRMIRGELRDSNRASEPLPPRVGDDPIVPGPVVCDDVPDGPLVPGDPGVDVWDELTRRIAEHFMFVGALSTVVLFAMGFDTLLRRRRRLAAWR